MTLNFFLSLILNRSTLLHKNEIFRNWRKTMTQRKTSEDLWASGLLKVTIELWEDEGISMDGEQILDFIQRNVEELTTFVTSEKSKERFFLTINKMCSIRNVSKSKFQEIMLCFVNRKLYIFHNN